MNSLTYIITLLSFFFLPAILFAAIWLFIIKRGWGSKWLLATLITLVPSSIVIVLWLGTQNNTVLFIGLALSVLSGVGFFVFLRTSSISGALIGQTQNAQSNFASLNEAEKNNSKRYAKLAVKNIFLIGFIQNLPLMVGIVIILLFRDSKSEIATSLGLFIMGFTGILRIVLRPKHISPELYSSKSKVMGNILVTLFAWSLALYGFFTKAP